MFSACEGVILVILYYCVLYHQACVRVWKITSSDLRILQGLEIPRTKGHELYFVSFSLKKYSELKRILPLVMVKPERGGTEMLFCLFFVHHLAYYLLVQNL